MNDTPSTPVLPVSVKWQRQLGAAGAHYLHRSDAQSWREALQASYTSGSPHTLQEDAAGVLVKLGFIKRGPHVAMGDKANSANAIQLNENIVALDHYLTQKHPELYESFRNERSNGTFPIQLERLITPRGDDEQRLQAQHIQLATVSRMLNALYENANELGIYHDLRAADGDQYRETLSFLENASGVASRMKQR